jgi:osmotically-inducible protein OsmY
MVDSQLFDLAQTALEQNPHLPHRHLRLEAQQGRVILRGVVRSFYQKQMAQESLRGVAGVEHIENQLQVDWV